MKIFIAGGNGLIGKSLSAELLSRGHGVTAMSRSIRPEQMPPGTEVIQADAREPGLWEKTLASHDVVVNLAGATIFHRWSKKYKKTMRDSRIETTRRIVDAATSQDSSVGVLVNASAVGFYGDTGEREIKESESPGKDFLAQLCVDWENEAHRAAQQGIRIVTPRFGIVLSPEGGALANLKKIFSLRLGSVLGRGSQFFSWIHYQDLVEIMVLLIENENYSGAVNCTAPTPVTNRALTAKLGGVMEKAVLLPPVPSFALRLLLGEFSSVLLTGQRAIPAKLIEGKYDFHFPALTPALQDLLY